MTRAAIGSLFGASIGAVVAFLARPYFDPPGGGVGFVTVHAYPKGWDYFVIAALGLGAFAGATLALAWTRGSAEPREPDLDAMPPRRLAQVVTAGVVFVLLFFVHDHPFAHMDPFHEGEHLTPAWLLLEGERPFGDVFLLHGLGVDGGLDALVGGTPPSTRRLQTVLDAATLALLVPIAAEVTVTLAGMLGAVLLSVCGIAALWVPVFPYFRLAPVLLAALGLLRYARTGRAGPLLLAFASAALGIVWSLDTGTYALAGTAVAFAIVQWRCGRGPRLPLARVAILALLALALPLVLLLAVRADLARFLRDSFVVIPGAIDAVWSLPAPPPLTAEGARYYLPPVFYGLLLAIGWKRRDARFVVVAVLSFLLFRTAAGRVSWSHTRFATPLLGIAFAGFVLERLRSRVAIAVLALAAGLSFEVPQNAAAGAKLLAGWPARQQHDGLVRHPFFRGIYTTEDNATQLATLGNFIEALGPGTILDFTNERALYAMLRRRPATRSFDVPMLSAPPLLREAILELRKDPPVCVILGGDPSIAVFDGVPNDVRVPEIARWIEVTYPNRTQIGRFVVATR